MTDPPTPRPGSPGSRVVALDHASLYASNRNNPQDVQNREGRGISTGLPQVNPQNLEHG